MLSPCLECCASSVCPACAGLEEEFVFVGRLDNLGMSYLSLQALIDSTSHPDALADETAVRAVALFDHEEVGSASAQGKQAVCEPKKQTVLDSGLSKGRCGCVCAIS